MASSKQPTSARQRAKECLGLLETSRVQFSNRRPHISEKLWQRFNHWIDDIGVLAEYRLSLDYRLREAPSLTAALMDMLHVLELQIHRVMIYEESTVEDSSDRGLDLELRGVDETLDWLHRFSLVVRNSVARDPLSRAARFMASKEGMKSIASFSDAVREFLERFPLGRNLTERLLDAVCLRRGYFLYCKSHQNKLARRFEESEPEGGGSEKEDGQPESEDISEHETEDGQPEPIPLRDRLHFVGPRNTDSATEVSEVQDCESSFIRRPVSPPAPSIASTSSWFMYTGDLEVPPAPNIGDNKEYPCPYCCLTLEAETFEDDIKWYRHIVKDLRPYVCIHEDCPYPDELFSSTRIWQDHLRKPHHSEWICPLHTIGMDSIGDSDHEAQNNGIFSEELDFERHLETCHPGSFSSKQIDILRRRCHRNVRAVVTCPFCEGARPEHPEAESIHQHIGQHLFNLAMLSLPRRPDLPDQDDNRRESDFERALSNHVSTEAMDNIQRWLEPTTEIQTEEETGLSLEDTPAETAEAYDENSGDTEDSGDIEYLSEDFHTSSLSDQIFSQSMWSNFPLDVPEQRFLPHGELDNLINVDSVTHELDLAEDSKELTSRDRDLIDFICQRAKKVFANAVLTGLEGKNLYKAMYKFMKHNFDDKALPVKKSEFDELPYVNLAPWNRIKRLDFIENQWKFLAPVFRSPESEANLNLELEQEHILPFIHVDGDRREGTFGNTYQVTVHPKHQDVPMRKANGELANAAIKEFKFPHGIYQKEGRVQEVWNAEATALYELSGLSHPHINQVKALITKGKRHYIMFQWADSGSLRDLYVHNRRPSLDPGFVKEVVLQLKGLADALDTLHNYSPFENQKKNPSQVRPLQDVDVSVGLYRHGDLKPENILRFEDSTRVGTWKLDDMGRAKRHFNREDFRGQDTPPFGTSSYEPPEVIKLLNRPSRLYDIWSMGCITLQLILWLLYGYDWLLRFNNSLKFRSEFENPYWMLEGHGNDQIAKVHSNVIACMEHVAMRDPECSQSTAIRDLLEIVKTKLLVVKLPRQSNAFLLPSTAPDTTRIIPSSGPTITEPRRPQPLEPFPGPFRVTAKVLCIALQEILEKGDKDDKYWFSGKPRDQVDPPPMLQGPDSNLLAAKMLAIKVPLVDRTKDAL